MPHRPPPDEDADITLAPELFHDALRELADAGVPLRDEEEAGWHEFRRLRARYEPLIAVLGRMTDAPRSDWSSWTDETPRHSPPLLRLDRG